MELEKLKKENITIFEDGATYYFDEVTEKLYFYDIVEKKWFDVITLDIVNTTGCERLTNEVVIKAVKDLDEALNKQDYAQVEHMKKSFFMGNALREMGRFDGDTIYNRAMKNYGILGTTLVTKYEKQFKALINTKYKTYFALKFITEPDDDNISLICNRFERVYRHNFSIKALNIMDKESKKALINDIVGIWYEHEKETLSR